MRDRIMILKRRVSWTPQVSKLPLTYSRWIKRKDNGFVSWLCYRKENEIKLIINLVLGPKNSTILNNPN